jgi:hypothetical protein
MSGRGGGRGGHGGRGGGGGGGGGGPPTFDARSVSRELSDRAFFQPLACYVHMPSPSRRCARTVHAVCDVALLAPPGWLDVRR